MCRKEILVSVPTTVVVVPWRVACYFTSTEPCCSRCECGDNSGHFVHSVYFAYIHERRHQLTARLLIDWSCLLSQRLICWACADLLYQDWSIQFIKFNLTTQGTGWHVPFVWHRRFQNLCLVQEYPKSHISSAQEYTEQNSTEGPPCHQKTFATEKTSMFR